MPPKERAADRGSRTARRLNAELGREMRESRISAGLTQVVVGRAVRVSPSQVSRIERGLVKNVSVHQLARLFAVIGLRLTAHAYPDGDALRDAAHLTLLDRVRQQLSPALKLRTEVPLPIPGDRRAWDGLISGPGVRVAVETETRRDDLQAADRRLALKMRDSGIDRLLLVVADTRRNRRVLREYAHVLRERFPLSGREALAALCDGRDPGGNAIAFL